MGEYIDPSTKPGFFFRKNHFKSNTKKLQDFYDAINNIYLGNLVEYKEKPRKNAAVNHNINVHNYVHLTLKQFNYVLSNIPKHCLARYMMCICICLH